MLVKFSGWQVSGQHIYYGLPAEERGGIFFWGSWPLSGKDGECILGLFTVGLKKIFVHVWSIGLCLVCSPWVSACACSSCLKHALPSVRSSLLERDHIVGKIGNLGGTDLYSWCLLLALHWDSYEKYFQINGNRINHLLYLAARGG